MGAVFSRSERFSPAQDIPDLSGKVILVTGGNAGLGKETIRQLAKHNPKTIFMASRSEEKAAAAIDEIKRESPQVHLEFLKLDLNSFKSISSAVKQFETQSDRLDVLLNNAGIMNGPYALTEDGYETQLGINHLGPALLTKLLMPTLLRTAEESNSDVRIINLSSTAYNFAYFNRGLELDTQKSKKLAPVTRYGISKLANLLHSRALRQRYPQITAASVHPGIIDTGLFDNTRNSMNTRGVVGKLWMGFVHTLMQTVETGALNQLWAVTAPKQRVKRGHFYEPIGKKSRGGLYDSQAQADRLWAWTEAELKKHGF